MDVKNESLWLMQGDCLERMKEIPDGSVDMVLTDPPYGTTACKWDSIIPLEPMWDQLNRVIKPNGAIVMTASQPFTTALIASNIKEFKHAWVWDKVTISNPMQAKYQPLRQHEDVLVFCARGLPPSYIPQKTDLHITTKWKQAKQHSDAAIPGTVGATGEVRGKYPKTIIRFPAAKLVGRTVHPTQKPVALMEYLIKTYTNEGETVLDFTAGSFTTGVACINTNRKGIMIEKDPHYFKIGSERVEKAYGTQNRIE